MTRKQCLDILDLPAGASRDEIIKAYRHLAVVWHPDRFPNNPELQRKAQAKLAQINAAYSALIEGRATPDASEKAPHNGGAQTAPNPSPEPIPAYRDGEVRYMGSDPRLKTPSPLSGLVGSEGVAAVVDISSEGLALVTFNAEGADEAMWYPESLLLAVEEGQNRWVHRGASATWPSVRPETIAPACLRLNFVDPEGILTHLIVVALKFRNAYYAQLFLKRLQAFIAFDKWAPPPPPSPPQQSTSPHSEFPIAAGVIFVAVLLVVVLLASIFQSPSNPTHSVSNSVPLNPEQLQPVQQLFPAHAQTKGSFTVWTEPEFHFTGTPFEVVIAVRVPDHYRNCSGHDVSGIFVASDGYQQQIPSNLADEVPVLHGVATFRSKVPGSTATLKIKSSLLGEQQTFELSRIYTVGTPSTPVANEQPLLSSSPLHAYVHYQPGTMTAAGFVLFTELGLSENHWNRGDSVVIPAARVFRYPNTGRIAGTVPAGTVGTITSISPDNIAVEFSLPRPLHAVYLKPWQVRKAGSQYVIAAGAKARISSTEPVPLRDANNRITATLSDGDEVTVMPSAGR